MSEIPAAGAEVTTKQVGVVDPQGSRAPWHFFSQPLRDRDLGVLVGPRWLHYVALVTVVATLALMTLGAEVTTKQVGMVDPQGFRTPWHFFSQPLRDRDLGFLVEHGHRLAGFVVGTLMIVLTAGAWFTEPRGWVRGLAVATLAAVCVQGLLGGFRVQLNALVGPQLALIHGLFAQVVFALLVSFALFTSRGWAQQSAVTADAGSGRGVRLWGLLLVGVLAVQIVLGGLVRHTEVRIAPRLHLVTASLVVLALAGLTYRLRSLPEKLPAVQRVAHALWPVLLLQLFLGVEAWLTRFRASAAYPQLQPMLSPADVPSGQGPWASFYDQVLRHPDFIRSVHLPVGAVLFAVSVAVCLYLLRQVRTAEVSQPQPSPNLEVAA